MGVKKGLLLCGDVIIPSLFPFTVCVLFVIRYPFYRLEKLIKKPAYFLFGMNSKTFLAFIFSFIGGYPTGAKLLADLKEKNALSQERAKYHICTFINAGPAFIVLAVGKGMLNSIKIGYVLLISHILSSVVCALLLRNKVRNINDAIPHSTNEKFNIGDAFVESVANSANALFVICAYVIFFSAVNEYLCLNPKLRFIAYFTEVTTGIAHCKNIYFISFLLGFGGISIWCQVFSIAKNIKINLPLFVVSRFLNGSLSYIFTFLTIKIFKIESATFCNNVSFLANPVNSSIKVAICIVMVSVLFVFSAEEKIKGGKLFDYLLK